MGTVIAINGSPRKTWNTAMLLEHAIKGAESAGAKTEIVHLYDLDYKGCIRGGSTAGITQNSRGNNCRRSSQRRKEAPGAEFYLLVPVATSNEE